MVEERLATLEAQVAEALTLLKSNSANTTAILHLLQQQTAAIQPPPRGGGHATAPQHSWRSRFTWIRQR